MVTMGYMWLQWVTCGYRGLHVVAIPGYPDVVTVDYMWLQRVTCGYARLHVVITGNILLHQVTCGDYM